MAYLGRQPVIGNFVKLDAITAVNGQAAYTMQNGSVNFTDYSTVNQFLVSLNGTIQSPGSSFTVSGSTLTFASNLSTGDVIDFIIVFGNSLSAGTPTDATVSTAKIVDDAVTAAKINNDIISGSTELATEPADTDEFLVSDAGTLKRIDYSLIKGGGITMAQQWRITSNFSGNATPVDANWEISDTDGAGGIGSSMSVSSGIFTFPSTGIYRIFYQQFNELNGEDRALEGTIQTTTDNSSYSNAANPVAFIKQTSSAATYVSQNSEFIFDVTDTSTHKCRFQAGVQNSSTTTHGNTTSNTTYATFIRLGDT